MKKKIETGKSDDRNRIMIITEMTTIGDYCNS